MATIRRGYEAMNSALASGEDLLPLMGGIDPDVVVEMGVLEGTFHGREGFVQFIEGQAAVFDNLRCDPGDHRRGREHRRSHAPDR